MSRSSLRTPRRTAMALCLLSTALAVLIGLVAPTAPTAAASTTRSAIVSVARGELGASEANGGCLKYGPCRDYDWCAMFATWVWRAAAVDDVPSTWVARALGEWGVEHGLFKRRTSTSNGNPQPGDWAIYGPPDGQTGGHVSVVSAVYSDGRISTVDGNVDDRVLERTIDPDTQRAGTDNVLISGYVSPPGVVAPTRTAFAGGAATSRGPSIIDLFYRASDRSVWHKVWNGTEWQSAGLGGQTLADPAAVATGSGRLDVFVIGTDYRLYVNTWLSGSTWSGWRLLYNGSFTSSPAATKRSDGGIDLFVRGANQDIVYLHYNLSTITGITNLGGNMTSAPIAIASEQGDRMTVFARGTGGTLMSRMWSAYNGPDGGWYSWVDRGVQIFGRPGATTRGGRSVDLFYRDGADDSLRHWYSPDAVDWSAGNQAELGGHIYSPPAAIARGSARIDVFSRNNEADLVQRYWVSGQGWSPYAGLGPIP
jgi:CHAP domain